MLGGSSQRGRPLLAFAGLLLVIAGCQVVAGIGDRKVDPLQSSCTFPGGGGPQVRVANLAPTGDLVDACIRASGSSSWGRPLLLGGGPACGTQLGAAGFAYAQVSVPFTAPASTVDVKMIPGGTTCDTAGLGEGDGLSLAGNAVTSLLLIGGNNVPETVVALPESDQATTALQEFRFVHAAPGTGPLDFGTTVAGALPTTVSNDFVSQPIAFGGTVPAGATSIVASATLGDNGYIGIFTGKFLLGASVDGQTNKAIFAYQSPGGTSANSMYAIGVAGDGTHPLRGLVCSEDSGVADPKDPLLSSCTLTQLSSLSVDMWNPALYGPNAQYFADREGLVPGEVAKRDSDVMCLVEVDIASDQTSIIQAAQGAGYKYNYTVTTNLSTPFTNPAAQNGQVPPAPTTSPCGSVDTDTINGAVSCAEQYCSDHGAGDPTGVLDTTTDCLVANCASAFLAVQNDTQGPGAACYDCLVVNIASVVSFGATQTACTQNTLAPLGFNGAENSLIISRYPLQNTDALILPSTDYRRSVLYAQLQLEDQTVDFYCGFLMTTENASALPYAGNYGSGPLNDPTATASQNAWNNEQYYEAQQFIAWQQQKSGSNPAVVVGDWHSSVAIAADAGAPPAGTFPPLNVNPQTMGLFSAAPGWTLAVASGTNTAWLPQCNVCPPPENPYNGATDQYFFSQPMLVNWPQASTAAIDESLIYTDTPVTLTGADAGLGPPSPYFGVNVRVIRPK